MYPGFSDYSAPANPNLGITPNPTTDSPNSLVGQTPTGNQTAALNYSNNISEYMRLLSGTERRELEIPRELYVNIKMLEVLEKAFTFEKVSETEHYSRTENIMKKMERLIQILQQKNPSLTIELFIQEYGLNDCTWVLQRLKKSQNKEGGQNVAGLVASVTSGFIRLPDYFYIHGDSAQVKDVLPMLQEMKQLLEMLKPHFSKPGQPFNLSDRYTPLITKVSGMGLTDVLNKEFVDEIQDVNEFAKNTFQIYLR